MIDDHGKANAARRGAAASAGLKAREKMNDKNQKVYDRFKALKGDDFDRACIEHMVKDHEMDVDAITKASKEAGNISIRDFAADTVPAHQSHLDLNRKILVAWK